MGTEQPLVDDSGLSGVLFDLYKIEMSPIPLETVYCDFGQVSRRFVR